ncbi:MAG: nucleotidyltransferase [Elusimicrobiota bacterium]
MKPGLVVLAAGIGSRYGGLKQMDPVGPDGEIVLSYSVYDALKAGFGKVVFVIRKDIEAVFRQTIGRKVERRCPTAYAFQELDSLPAGSRVPPERKKPWGTAHALWCARGAGDGAFAVINADDYYGRGAFERMAAFLGSKALDVRPRRYALAGYVLRNTLSDHGHVSRGVCEVGRDHFLTKVVEREKIRRDGRAVRFMEGGRWRALDEDCTVSMGLWGFDASIFDAIEGALPGFLRESGGEPKAEMQLPSVVTDMIERGDARVRVLPTGEKWFGVTHRKDMARVKSSIQELIEQGWYGRSLWGDG